MDLAANEKSVHADFLNGKTPDFNLSNCKLQYFLNIYTNTLIIIVIIII